MGDPAKVGRKSEEDFLASLELVAELEPEVLVLHQGPHGDRGQRGSEAVAARVGRLSGVVVCGHAHWEQPLAEIAQGPQVLNVDGRVVILRRASSA